MAAGSPCFSGVAPRYARMRGAISGGEETDCHTSDIGHWFAMTKRRWCKIEDEVKLGTPEAAVRACVGLLAQLFHLKESRLAYYLDLYWQVRQAYEKAEEEERRDPPPASPEPPLGKGAEEENADKGPADAADWARNFVADMVGVPPDVLAASSCTLPEALIGPLPPGGVVYEKPKAGKVLSEVLKDAPKAEQSAEAAESPATPDGFVAIDLQQSPAAKAAADKRRILDRLIRYREAGWHIKKIVEEANGSITEKQVRGILERQRYGINVYRVLEATLDRLEEKRGDADCHASVSTGSQ